MLSLTRAATIQCAVSADPKGRFSRFEEGKIEHANGPSDVLPSFCVGPRGQTAEASWCSSNRFQARRKVGCQVRSMSRSGVRTAAGEVLGKSCDGRRRKLGGQQ